MEKIAKIMSATTDQNSLIHNIDTVLEDFKTDIETKYFVLVNGIFDEHIYKQLKSRIPIIKHVNKLAEYFRSLV